MTRDTLPDWFMARVAVQPNGCWHWTGSINDAGYGRLQVGSSRVRVHRWVYEQCVGPIPDGLDIDHVCHNADESCVGGPTCRHRRCVNPGHLEPVSRAVNVLRGKGTAARQSRQTVCQNGHPLSGRNLVARNGRRGCRKCRSKYERARPKRDQREYLRAYRASNREALAAKDKARRGRKNELARARYAARKIERGSQ